MVSKLDKHEWDENCSFCMANPWLQETKEVADLLPKLKQEENTIYAEIKYITNAIDDIQKQLPDEKLQFLSNLKHQLGISNGTLIAQQHQLEKIKWDIETFNDNIHDKKKQL